MRLAKSDQRFFLLGRRLCLGRLVLGFEALRRTVSLAPSSENPLSADGPRHHGFPGSLNSDTPIRLRSSSGSLKIGASWYTGPRYEPESFRGFCSSDGLSLSSISCPMNRPGYKRRGVFETFAISSVSEPR